jgi:hypothetical protein
MDATRHALCPQCQFWLPSTEQRAAGRCLAKNWTQLAAIRQLGSHPCSCWPVTYMCYITDTLESGAATKTRAQQLERHTALCASQVLLARNDFLW